MATTNGDAWVRSVQEWYNATYSGKTGYIQITADGIVGPGTCSALIRALQMELGVSGANGNFGPGTINAFDTTGITPSTTNENLIRILQGGFICKGIDCGGFDGIYGDGLMNAVAKFREYTGIGGSGNMDARHMKALLNTDPFVLSPNGRTNLRLAQQFLNKNYSDFFWKSIGLIPTNGIADRNMSKALAYALQYEEAVVDAGGGEVSTSGIDGIVGTNTLNKAPVLTLNSTKTSFVRLLQIAITAMHQQDVGIDGLFDSDVHESVCSFQKFMCLTQDPSVTSGTVCRKTWAAFLLSKGDVSRTATACDCSQQLTLEMAQGLFNHGYRIVGRYLTGTVGGTRNKYLTKEEINAISSAGLSIFAIYQDGGASSDYFNYNQGCSDAEKACLAARSLGIYPGEIIYFAVDYDFMAKQTETIVIPHFQGINDYFTANNIGYRIGIYGSRNICSMVSDEGLACSSFVADMSTGYSGNMGYPLPDNWAFDQFYEYTFAGYDNSNGSFSLDKDVASGRYTGFTSETGCWSGSRDVTKHHMYLSGGNYICSDCGYTVKAPELQDKDVLDSYDYILVKGLLHSFFSSFITKRSKNIFAYMLSSMIQEIRTKDTYNGKFEYQDSSGNCANCYAALNLAPTAYEPNSNRLIRVTSDNLHLYSGIISDLLEYFLGFVYEGLEVPEYIELHELYQEYKAGENMESATMTMILQKIFDKLGEKAFGNLIGLLELGININENTASPVIEEGDYIIKPTVTAGSGYINEIVLDKNGQIKLCAFHVND